MADNHECLARLGRLTLRAQGALSKRGTEFFTDSVLVLGLSLYQDRLSASGGSDYCDLLELVHVRSKP